MKKLIAAIVAFMIATSAWAQSDEEIVAQKLLRKCKSEMEEVSKKKVKINDLAFNSDGHWLILYGDFGYSFSYVPTDMENLLVSLNQKEKKIKQALLDGESWVLLYDKNEFTSSGYKPEAVKILNTCKGRNSSLTGIFVGPNGECLGVFGTNGYVSRGCPDKMVSKIGAVNKKHYPIKNAMFSNNCWALFYGNGGFCFQGLPSDLQSWLKSSISKKYKVDFVRMFGDKWFVVYDGYKFETNVD